MRLSADDLRRAAKLSLYRASFDRYAVDQLRIRPKTPGQPIIPFHLNAAQHVVERIARQQLDTTGKLRLVVLKYRQPGISTWASAHGFHMASLHPNVSSVVIAHDDETAEHIFSINKLFYDSLSMDIRPLARYHTKEELVFENPDPRTRTRWPGLRSRITCMTAKNAMAGTGHTMHVVHLSEASKYGPTVKELWASLKPSIPDLAGTSIIIESTAHFADEWFRDFYERAKSGQSGYAAVFLPWTLSEEYTESVQPGEMDDLDEEERFLQQQHTLTLGQVKWRRARIAEQGGDEVAKKFFSQEFPLTEDDAWIDMNMGVFDGRALLDLERDVCPAPWVGVMESGSRLYERSDGELSIWEHPLPGEVYDVAADVASGDPGGDWSVGIVLKRRNREQVAQWRGHIGPLDFAKPLYWMGMYYHVAQLGVEVTGGLGLGTNARLQELNYPNLYVWRKQGTVVPKLTPYSGWQTSYESKKWLVTRARHYVAHREVILRSPVLYQELREFAIRQTDQREYYRGSGKYDDCTMAWLIALTIGLDELALAGEPRPASPPPLRVHREPGLYDERDMAPSGHEPLVQLAETLKGWG
jgi:hypothetical protein